MKETTCMITILTNWMLLTSLNHSNQRKKSLFAWHHYKGNKKRALSNIPLTPYNYCSISTIIGEACFTHYSSNTGHGWRWRLDHKLPIIRSWSISKSGSLPTLQLWRWLLRNSTSHFRLSEWSSNLNIVGEIDVYRQYQIFGIEMVGNIAEGTNDNCFIFIF